MRLSFIKKRKIERPYRRKVIMCICPNCKSKDIGKIGTSQYYCWGCFIEFAITNDKKLNIFQVEEDGTLSSLNDLFEEEEFGVELNLG
jgi:Zn finger protein HypA/HybF involved in hydrogenase expression